MPRIIVTSRYLKPAKSGHRSYLIKYIATRENTEMVSPQMGRLPATAKQERLIEKILNDFPDTKDSHEYTDYVAHPNRKNASAFIAQAIENNIDRAGNRKNYMDYIANRPRVERVGTHGLFTDDEVPVVLDQVAKVVSEHPGNVWTTVVSLRREDAARLGFDSAVAWMRLLRSKRSLLAESMKIRQENLRWYASFHNESHHPHVHLVAYSVNPREGYLTGAGIEKMRSAFAREIFRQELLHIYEQQTERRGTVNKQAQNTLDELLEQMRSGASANKQIEADMLLLAERLKRTHGKKVYGYLQPELKTIINRIIDELSGIDMVAAAYAAWIEMRNEVLLTYSDKLPEPIPLSGQKEFAKIRQIVIDEAMKIVRGEIDIAPDVSDGDDTVAPDEVPDDSPEPEADIGNTIGKIEKAARFGNAYAQYALAKKYLSTEGDDAAISKALEWMHKAADNGNASAQYALAKLYLAGKHIGKNTAKAVELFTAAAEQGNHYAAYALGRLFLFGNGVKQDKEESAFWLSRSAAQGNVHAQHCLDHMNDYDSSVLNMTARLLYRLSRIFEDNARELPNKNRSDSKARRKEKLKKIAQGHARDDREQDSTMA